MHSILVLTGDEQQPERWMDRRADWRKQSITLKIPDSSARTTLLSHTAQRARLLPYAHDAQIKSTHPLT
jgi:hypothetical protein